uniref:Uncharacterized protein n=1 Tax=Glossina palpalis gambiensis TaxID=67801 RepID=A0A1B0C4C4_9MUSC
MRKAALKYKDNVNMHKFYATSIALRHNNNTMLSLGSHSTSSVSRPFYKRGR